MTNQHTSFYLFIYITFTSPQAQWQRRKSPARFTSTHMTGGCFTPESAVQHASSSNLPAPSTAVSTNTLLHKDLTVIALHCKHCLLCRSLQQMCPAFWSPLRVGEQLHRCSEHTILPALPLQRVRHGGRHCPTDGRHAASCRTAIRTHDGQFHRWTWREATSRTAVCCTGDTQRLLPCYCLHFKSHVKLKLILCFSPPPQHLFLTFPRIVFMLGFLVFVFFLLAGYALFHSYLAVVNQTSNEWYKTRGYVCQHCHPTVTADNLCDPAPDHSKRYYYSRGVLRNLREIFLPPQPVHKKDNWKIDPALCVAMLHLPGICLPSAVRRSEV